MLTLDKLTSNISTRIHNHVLFVGTPSQVLFREAGDNYKSQWFVTCKESSSQLLRIRYWYDLDKPHIISQWGNVFFRELFYGQVIENHLVSNLGKPMYFLGQVNHTDVRYVVDIFACTDERGNFLFSNPTVVGIPPHRQSL